MLKLSDATAVLLAGGKSSRMGSDKGLVEFRNKPMASHILEVLKTLFSLILYLIKDLLGVLFQPLSMQILNGFSLLPVICH